ncbi:MAG: ABC transporter ATP-binding protein/permease [Lachnospiraceae bacterium]|nr:ABC transporter ATP-binding protein/permease [Lachnospiraceae bacterium]
MIKKLAYIFNKKEKIKLLFLMIMIIIGSFIELMGVAAFMPFITAITDESAVSENRILSLVYGILNEPEQKEFLAAMAIGISIIYILKNLYLGVLQNSILKFSYTIRKNLSVRLLSTYMKEPYTFHLNKNGAELQRSLLADTNQFMLLVNNTLQFVAEASVCAVLGIYLFDTSHSMAGIVIVLLVVCVGAFFLVAKKISKRLGERNQMYNAKLIQWVHQSLGGIKEVKVLGREKYFINAYEENYEGLIWGARINELLSALPRYIVEAVCITGLLAAIIGKMFWGYSQNTVLDFVPQLAVFAVGAFRLLPSVGKINAFTNNILYCVPSLDLIYSDLRQIEDCEESINSGREKLDFKKEIRVDSIVYRYPDGEEYVLDHASLEIPKGLTAALIGSSGTGKTTLADVILGLLTPESGHVWLDNVDVFENLQGWHAKLGYIPQNIYLSDDTIKNNVALGIAENEIDEGAIWTALKKAQLEIFVRGLPLGLDTMVGEAGVRLSGGQRQRIGIARALYHDPEILVLDEATSALDNDTEKAVMEAIDSLKGEKTMIIIAHRLTTIRNADRIYEVIDGKAVERNKEEVLGQV